MTGLLKGVTLFIVPGGSTVPAGEGTAFTVQMKARAGVEGVSQLVLRSSAEASIGFLDAGANSFTANVVNGSVTVGNPQPTMTATITETPTLTNTPDVNATATDTHTPTNTPTVTNTATATTTGTITTTVTPSPTKTATASPTLTNTPTTALRSASMKLIPDDSTVPPGFAFPIHVSHNANFVVSGAETDIVFDPNLLEVVSVVKSPAYNGAQLVAGTTDLNVTPPKRQTVAEAIAEANSTGHFKNVAVFYAPGQGSAAAGENAFITLNFKSRSADGVSDLKLENTGMIDEAGLELAVNAVSGRVTVQTGAVPPTPVPPPTAPGSGSTSGGSTTTTGGTNSVAGASTRAGAAARALPRAGDGGFGADQAVLFVIGSIIAAAGAVMVAGGWRKRSAS